MLSSKSVLTIVVALFSSLILDAQVCPNGNTKITVQPQTQKICEGSSVSMSVTATGDNLRYEWFRNTISLGSNTQVLNLPVVSRGQNDGTYSVKVTGNCGIVESIGVMVEVYEEPTAKITSVSKLEACQSEGEIQITTSSINDYDLGTWIGDVIPSGSDGLYTVNTADLKVASNTLIWQVSNAACGNRSDQTTITIAPITAPTISLASIPTLCYGDNAAFTAQIGSEDVNGTYIWDFTGDDLAPVTTSRSQHSFYNIQSSGEVYVSYTSRLKCDLPIQVTKSVDLVAIEKPVLKMLSRDTSICESSILNLEAKNDALNKDNVQYSWQKDGAPYGRKVIVDNGLIPLDNVSETGIYTLLAENGVCESVLSEGVGVTVYQVPYVEANVNSINEISVFEGDLLSLNGAHSGQSAVWSMLGDVNSIFEDDIDLSTKIVTLNNAGVYYIKLTAVDGPCIASDVVTIEIKKPTGVNQLISKKYQFNGFVIP